MIRISHVLILLMAVWCAGLLVWTSQSVQKTERELSQVQREKIAEIEAVRVLMSEWEYLNRPNRIEALIQEYQFAESKEIVDKKMLLSLKDIRQPIIPAVPLSKPQNLFKKVSTGHVDGKVQTPVRVNKETNFDSVIHGILKEENQ